MQRHDSLFSEIKGDLLSNKLLPAISAGLVISLMTIVLQVSFASMIFSGPLSSFIGRGIGIMIAGTFVFIIVTTLFSQIKSVIAMPQDAPVALFAGIAAAIATTIGKPDSIETFITVTCGLILTGVLTGLFFYLGGRFRMAELLRYMPYPVVGGFLAGTGWLLSKGSIEVMAGITVNLQTINQLIETSTLVLWLPGVIYAFTLFFLLRHFQHFLILPSSLLFAVGLYYAAIYAAGISLGEARSMGMIYEPFAEASLWPAFSLSDFAQVNWAALLQQLPTILIIPLISMLGLLLNTGGIELALKQEIDMNRELKLNSLANTLSGLLGTCPGYSTISLTLLGNKVGAYSRLVGLTVAALLLITLVIGSTLLAVIPKVVLGGFLMLLGLFFISDWLIDTAKKMPRADHLVVLLIFLVIGALGYMQGVIVGIIITMMLFIVRFSRISLVSGVCSLTEGRSSKNRPLTDQRLLNIYGSCALVYNLEGYIFFGSVTKLIDDISQKAKNNSGSNTEQIILNFSKVSGFDISSVNNFIRLINRFSEENLHFVIAESPKGFNDMLKQNLDTEITDKIKFFAHIEEALQWAEDKLISKAKSLLRSSTADGENARSALFDNVSDDLLINLERQASVEVLVEEIKSYLDERNYSRNDIVLEHKEKPDGIYFIIGGVITELDALGGKQLSVRRELGPGSFFAEPAALASWPSPYSYRAKTDLNLSVLSAEAFHRLEIEKPEIAIRVYRLIFSSRLL